MSDRLQRYEAVTEGNGNNYALTEDADGPFCLSHEVTALEARIAELTDKQCDHLNTKGALQSTQDHNAKLRAEVERLLGVVDAALEFRACYIGISPNSFITQPGVKYAEVIKKWKALVAALKEATDE